ncbi:hypothetical protein DL93DRAFT_2074170 [Clavulina sp. PMI_390]|nr:hypothetical protein DL93DRAFT_2074170 [Clavulina sp. PMI_390]
MERAASIMSDASRYSSEPVDAISKALPPISPPPALPPRRPPTHSKSESQASVPQPDSEPVSWEERTWKELVKLREDMFWARMGGVRTSDEDTTTVSTPV